MLLHADLVSCNSDIFTLQSLAFDRLCAPRLPFGFWGCLDYHGTVQDATS